MSSQNAHFSRFEHVMLSPAEAVDQLDIRGALVSADAIQTQRKCAEYIVEQKQADYLMVVKANQPKLFDRLARLAKASDGTFFPPGHHSGSGARTP